MEKEGNEWVGNGHKNWARDGHYFLQRHRAAHKQERKRHTVCVCVYISLKVSSQSLVGVLVAEDLSPLLASSIDDDSTVANQDLLASLDQTSGHSQGLRLLHNGNWAAGLVGDILDDVLGSARKEQSTHLERSAPAQRTHSPAPSTTTGGNLDVCV